MTERGPQSSTGLAPRPEPAGLGTSRRVVRRLGLPGGRAVVGGFLIAVAVVGVFGAYLSATGSPDTAYAVAATDLAGGDVLAGDDVEMVPIDLPEVVRARALVDAQALVGARVLHAKRAGELIHADDVMRPGAEPGTRELSFATDASRALGDRILPGERIDLLATYGSGEASYTIAVVSGALVLRSSADGGTLAGQGQVEFTLALDRVEDTLAVAHAVDSAQITVVRATNADEAAGALRYQPDPGVAAGVGP